MLDFMKISVRNAKNGTKEIYPRFMIRESSDLMIRGGDFYAIWVEDRGLWSTKEQDAIDLIDRELDRFAADYKEKSGDIFRVLHVSDAETRMISVWHQFCQKDMRDSFHVLDETLVFADSEVSKKDYASKRLPYPLKESDCHAYDSIMSVLYSPEERHKIEWAIGSIVTGESKKIQKFVVLYGAPGTGKGTVLKIVRQLFAGYCSVFDARALGTATNVFALEAFRTNPLVAIQEDGDLSRIEDNTRLNSLVSHEVMTVNEKYKSTYENSFKCFLFMGTNAPVKITDAKSGIMRRLIDVSPTGEKIPTKAYNDAMHWIPYELGGIACRCRDVYLENPNFYDNYTPINMLGASNDFYDFMIDSYHVFNKENGTSLKVAWEMYKTYCEDAKVNYPYSMRKFKEELKSYFYEFSERFTKEDGSKVRSYYTGFRTDKFEPNLEKMPGEEIPEIIPDWLQLKEQQSALDDICAECPAQYASAKETPMRAWDKVTTKLKDLDTRKLHYAKVPLDIVTIDFDLKDENGEKSLERNLKAASKWPPTYAEVSKGGSGLHLSYRYLGDPTRLDLLYSEGVEVKVNTGNSSLRRKLTLCNSLAIAPISSGLPLKGEKMVAKDVVQTEKGMRTTIKKCMNKEIHPGTKPNVDFIYKILEDAYASGMHYDLSDMEPAVIAFAAGSTNQSDYCLKLVSTAHFKSDDASDPVEPEEDIIVFFDVEVFPNLFLVNWKKQGEGEPVVRMINPTPEQVSDLTRFKLVGFNNRRYDNHMLYARILGYSEFELYQLSQRIIVDKDPSAFFGEAYNLSYTDILDFATTKQSLKKWEIELGIHHKELGLPWDKPVPQEMWEKVAEYCDNDVIATEAVFNAREGDFAARKIQVDIVKKMHGIENVTVNDTTNTLSQKIIFGRNKKPQSAFNWRDLSKPVSWTEYDTWREKFGKDYKFRIFDAQGIPTYEEYAESVVLPEGWSILPFFPKYRFEFGKSYWIFDLQKHDKPIKELKEGKDYVLLGEGGRVDAVPGMYTNVWDGDVASMHPHSVIFECLFGPEYTKRFEEIVKARVAIKHKDFEAAGKMLGGALKPYLTDELAGPLAQALKIVINSIYGLTSASFENAFRDPRNRDNIVAKRGALFMTLLSEQVRERGFTVAHIKTDSIKIPNATNDIRDFVVRFGKEFGYTFETEAEFERFCLVNNAVYIAKVRGGEWSATGAQFAVPYVFKTLFTHEPIEFKDLCETKSVTTALYLDMNESLPDVTAEEKELEKLAKAKKEIPKELTDKIAEGHNYVFVGRIGQFTPVKEGCGGGLLVREKEGKYYSATGASGYRWLESEMVEQLGKEDCADHGYYRNLVNEAKASIAEFGDFEWFVSDDPVPEVEEKKAEDGVAPWQKPDIPDVDDIPFDIFEDDEVLWARR